MNHYAAAIDILANQYVDWHALAVEVAKAHPKALVEAASRIGLEPAEPRESLRVRCKALMAQNEKIKAIKLWREETRASLVDAKNAVEAL